MARRLIVVSNRGPVGYDRGADGRRVRLRGSGGLVTALRPLVSLHDVTWIASAMTEEEREIAASGSVDEVAADGARFRLRLVAHDPDAYRDFYDVVANAALWFVQHDMWNLKREAEVDLVRPWEQGYAVVNEGFANAVVEELDRAPDAAVLFQDYHFYVAPALVRARRPEARLAQFVHIPWVGPAGWAVLPEEIARAVHEGLLANDSVGFHTERWRAAFVESCAALLGRGHEALAHSHANPIAVDAAELEELATSTRVLEREHALLSDRPEQLIVRVDRTDPAKNAIVGFDAFAVLLERRPDLRGRVGMVALLDPSRQTIPEYVDYLEALEAAAAVVNTRFGTESWSPVVLRIRDDFPSSVAAYKQYDVLLVNPLRDGLNLVAKEAPLVNVRDGVVVLSRDAGAWEELREWALGIDPSDIDGTAAALEQALELPRDERARRSAGLRAQVRAHTTTGWVEAELAALGG